MKHRSCVLLWCITCALATEAQYWMRGWGSFADDRIEAMEPLPGGDVIAVGSFSGFFNLQDTDLVTQGVTDAFVARVDPAGTVVWVRAIGGAGVDRGLDVAVDDLGRIAMVGQYAGTLSLGANSISSNNGSLDGFVAVFDDAGNLQWTATMGSPQNADRANAVALAPDGSVLVAGAFSHTADFNGSILTSAFDNLLNGPGIDVFLARYGPAGVFQWVRQGSAVHEEEAVSVACDNVGAAYFAGRFSDDITFQLPHANAQDDAAFLVKYDATGSEVWFRRLAGAVVNQAADLEWEGSALYLAGYQSGSTIFFGNGNTPVGSNYANSAFVLKVDAAGALTDQWSLGSDAPIGAVDLCIGDTALVVGGWFECFLTQVGDERGSGLFMSIGPRNDWVAELGLQSLTHGYVQQFGSHFAGGVDALSLGDDEAITAAGSYRKELIIAGIDSVVDAVPPLLVSGINDGAIICGDGAYGDFYSLDSIGLEDAFIMAAFPRQRSIFDVFEREPDTCDLSVPGAELLELPPGLLIGDTLFACGGGSFAFDLPFPVLSEGSYGVAAPWSAGLWHDGSTGFANSAGSLEQLWITAYTLDGCYTASDTAWGGIWPVPPPATITDDQGVNVECTSCDEIIVCFPINPVLTATVPDSISSFYWTLPNDSLSSDTVITADASGLYILTTVNSYGCTNNASVDVLIVLQASLDSLTADLVFEFPEDLDNNDTLVLCGGGSITGNVFHTVYENGVPLVGDPAGITALDSVFSGSGVLLSNGPLPISANPGIVSTTAVDEGWYVFEYRYYLRNFPCDSDAFVFTAFDSIYVDTLFTTYTNVYISGPINICAGNLVELTAVTTDAGTLSWSGPGILGDTTAVSVEVVQPGFYFVALTPYDTGLCVYASGDVHLITIDPAPYITMTPPDGLICPGDSILLTSTEFGSFQWYGPTGPIGGNSNTLYVSEPGTYFVVLTGPGGCGTASNTVEVINYSTPYLAAYPQPVLCNGGTVTLNVNAPGNAALIQWLPPLTGNGLSQTVSQPGTYQCSITVCGITSIAEIEVIASTLSVGLLDPGPFDICNDSTALLQATPGLTAYLWIPSLATGESAWVGPGEHSVVGFDEYGCTDTAGVALVNAIAFTDSLSAAAAPVCLGDTSLLTATGSGLIEWFADPGTTQSIGTGGNIAYGPVNGNTTVYVTQTESGCESDAFSVNIGPLALPPTLPIQGDSLLCQGDTLALYLDPSNFFPQTWWLPDGTTLNQPPFAATAALDDTGWYSAVYPDGNGCLSLPDSIYITVFPNPDPALPADTLICIGESVTIEAAQGWQSYAWSTGANSSAILVSEPGTYSLVVTGEGGCSAADSIVVDEGPCDLDVTNVITPNGDGTNDVIDLDLSGFKSATFKIWNRWGQKLDEITAPRIIWEGRDRLTGEPVPSGTYYWILTATRASGTEETRNGYVTVLGP